MKNIRTVIQNVLSEIMLPFSTDTIKESSEKFAERLSPKSLADAQNIYNDVLKLGSRANFNISFVNYYNSKGQGTETGHMFDYVVEKLVETYKQTDNEAIKAKIADGLKFAYMPPNGEQGAFLYIIFRNVSKQSEGESLLYKVFKDPEYRTKLVDLVKEVYMKKIINVERLIDAYQRSGSFTGLVVITYKNGLVDELRKKMSGFALSLDQPLGGNSGEDERTLGDVVGASDEDKPEHGLSDIKKWKKITLLAIQAIKQEEPIKAGLIRDIVLYHKSPQDIMQEPTFLGGEQNPYHFQGDINSKEAKQMQGKITTDFRAAINGSDGDLMNKIYRDNGLNIDVKKWNSKSFYNPTAPESYGDITTKMYQKQGREKPEFSGSDIHTDPEDVWANLEKQKISEELVRRILKMLMI